MISPAQQELLDSFIGAEGDYFTTIRDHEVFDLGTKVLYLERAITQNCQDFLQSLDKIYNPSLSGANDTIEFIRALKVINDICFNNEVNLGEYGIKLALDYFFLPLSSEINPLDFKIYIETNINARILELQYGREEEVISQKNARQLAENDMNIQTRWREILDLPTNQRAITSYGESNNAVFLQLVHGLAARYNAGQRFLENISLEFLRDLLTYRDNFDLLVHRGEISLVQLYLTPEKLLHKMLNHTGIFAELFHHTTISLDDLLSLEEEKLDILINNYCQVIDLVNNTHIDLQQLLNLTVDQLEILITNFRIYGSEDILSSLYSGNTPRNT